MTKRTTRIAARVALAQIAVLLAVVAAGDAITSRRPDRRADDGQATAEYALVLLGAAAIALAVISWASRTNLIGRLLDVVFGGLLRKAR